MERFTILTGVAAPVPLNNLDTDMIIRVDRSAGLPPAELGPYALETWRFGADGTPNPDCALNRKPYDQAKILIGGENFGCGSARETAVWALHGFGVRCVIAPSFGGAFFENLFGNGMLPIRLPADQVASLQALALRAPELTIDLPAQQIRGDGLACGFEVEPLRKRMLIEGLDQIGLTLKHAAAIEAFQTADRRRRPWLLGD